MHLFSELWAQIAAITFAAGVLGNLVASAVQYVLVFLPLHRKLNRQHKELMNAHLHLPVPELRKDVRRSARDG